MIPSPSLSILFASARVAARTFAILKGFAQACRPVAAPFHAQSAQVILPGRRAVSVICTASPSVRVQGQCLLLREQWSTDPWTRASNNLGQFIQGERA
jgi:hypothetical protein